MCKPTRLQISCSVNSVDYTKLVTLLPLSSDQVAEARRSLRLLEPRIEEAQKREMGEMVDKLKGFGNSILGERDALKLEVTLKRPMKGDLAYRQITSSLNQTVREVTL